MYITGFGAPDAARTPPAAAATISSWDAQSPAPDPAPDPDALYRQRDQRGEAERAASVWRARASRNPQDFEAAWKLARACYWLGTHAEPDARRAWLETGITAGRQGSQIRPDRPDGFFWMAANMGALAESFGIRAGLRYRRPIKDALERVLAIDAAYLSGSADRALGRWYFEVPAWLGGSQAASEAHLRRSLAYDPASTASLYFLAETLFARDKDEEAVATLRAVLAAPVNPEWAPEDREFQEKARHLLVAPRR